MSKPQKRYIFDNASWPRPILGPCIILAQQNEVIVMEKESTSAINSLHGIEHRIFIQKIWFWKWKMIRIMKLNSEPVLNTNNFMVFKITDIDQDIMFEEFCSQNKFQKRRWSRMQFSGKRSFFFKCIAKYGKSLSAYFFASLQIL